MKQAELHGLVARAALLYERLDPAWQPARNPFDADTVARRLARWCQLAAGGDWDRFGRRLAWDGLDLDAARRIVGAGGFVTEARLPAWADFLAQVLSAPAASHPLSTTPRAEDAIACAIPLADAARIRLDSMAGHRLAWLSASSRRSLRTYLEERLAHLAQPALAARGQRGRGHPTTLVALCTLYPVLARKLAARALDWVTEVADFLTRLDDDWQALAQYAQLPDAPAPDVVFALCPGLSDPHRGGRTVWQVTFAGGSALAYKPKDTRLDRAWSDLIAWCVARGLTPAPGVLWVLPRREYGWMAWVEQVQPSSSTDARTSAHNAGALLGLLHLLHAADCHADNIGFAGDHLVLLDAEMLVYPQFAGSEADDALTVARTGLLPRWLHTTSSPTEFGGLADKDGTGFPPEDMCDGYRRFVRFAAHHWTELSAADGPLDAFRRGYVRVAPRPTWAYLRLLDHLRHPAFLMDGSDASIETDQLAAAYLHDTQQAQFYSLLRTEHASIAQDDVPVFYGEIGRPDLIYDGGSVPDCLIWPGFSPPAPIFQAQQEGLIRASLARTSGMAGRSGSFLEDARRLGDLLARCAVAADGGGRTWLAVQPVSRSGLRQHGLVGEDLYAGRAGIALFFAGLARMTGEREWRDLALDGLCGDPTPLVDPGGRLYALCTIADLVDEPQLEQRAAILAQRTTTEAVAWRSAVCPWGVVDGEAGLLLGLLAHHRRSANQSSLELALACGQRIVNAEDEWRQRQHGLGGFAHGATGIAHALRRLVAQSGDPSCLEAARRGWEARQIYDGDPAQTEHAGQDAQSFERASWCHGAAGIGLAAAAAINLWPDVLAEAERSAQTLYAAESPLDTLCCGQFGRIDCLLEMGLLLVRADWVAQAIRLAQRALDRARTAGHFRLDDALPGYVLNPGFFRGVAGIGYTLLRLATAQGEMGMRLPCVLRLQD